MKTKQEINNQYKISFAKVGFNKTANELKVHEKFRLPYSKDNFEYIGRLSAVNLNKNTFVKLAPFQMVSTSKMLYYFAKVKLFAKMLSNQFDNMMSKILLTLEEIENNLISK